MLVGLSGGVDSSFVFIHLVKSGFNVIPAVLKLYPNVPDNNDIKNIVSLVDKFDLRRKLIIKDVSMEFKSRVINYLLNEARNGRLINICFTCNNFLKIPALISVADSVGADCVATGHYARVININGKVAVAKALDESKDQSFFLGGLKRNFVNRLVLPNGWVYKKDVIKAVESEGFEFGRESFSVCFLKSSSVDKFVADQLGNRKVEFFDRKGVKIGESNEGKLWRVGLNVSGFINKYGKWFVRKVDGNKIIIGRKPYIKEIVGRFIVFDGRVGLDNLLVKTSNNSKMFHVKLFREGEKFKVRFDEVIFGVAKGQVVVFYDGDVVVGSGIIDDVVLTGDF